MCVDARATYDTNVDALTRRAPLTDREAHLCAIFAALDAKDAQDAADVLTCPMSGQDPASRPAEQPRTEPNDELAHSVKRAERGEPGSARRVAELLELTNRNDEAAKWWHRAADLGDEDAIDYVREFLTK
jgi:folylpolyglutamate synthase/dihydropteroate synthase